MKKMIGLTAALAILSLMPGRAEAQRRGGGNVTTPFGTFNANEMRAAGGDPFTAEAMREQRMAVLQQQQMLKQQQLYMQQMAKQQKAYQDYLKKHPEAAKAATTAPAPTKAAKKKKSTTKDATTAEAKADPKKDSTETRVPGAPATTKAK